MRDAHLDERLAFACVAELFVEADRVMAGVQLNFIETSSRQRLLEVTYQRTTETHALVRRLHRHLSQLPAGRRVRREHHASNDVTLVEGDEEHRIVIALDDQVRP